MNLWFALAVGRPTLLDELIEFMSGGGHFLISLVAIVLWLLVLLGHYTLWCLMHVGLIASASLMRRMEFDADCYEVGVIGSAEFEGFCQRLLELTVAHDLAIDYAFGSRDCRLLPSDLVAFIAELANREPKVKKRARKLIALEGHDWLVPTPGCATALPMRSGSICQPCSKHRRRAASFSSRSNRKAGPPPRGSTVTCLDPDSRRMPSDRRRKWSRSISPAAPPRGDSSCQPGPAE